MSLGIVLGTTRTQGHALTNCATLAPSARAQASSAKRLSRALNHAHSHFRLLPASLHALSSVSRKFLLVESGILNFGIRNTTY